MSGKTKDGLRVDYVRSGTKTQVYEDGEAYEVFQDYLVIGWSSSAGYGEYAVSRNKDGEIEVDDETMDRGDPSRPFGARLMSMLGGYFSDFEAAKLRKPVKGAKEL